MRRFLSLLPTLAFLDSRSVVCNAVKKHTCLDHPCRHVHLLGLGPGWTLAFTKAPQVILMCRRTEHHRSMFSIEPTSDEVELVYMIVCMHACVCVCVCV